MSRSSGVVSTKRSPDDQGLRRSRSDKMNPKNSGSGERDPVPTSGPRALPCPGMTRGME